MTHDMSGNWLQTLSFFSDKSCNQGEGTPEIFFAKFLFLQFIYAVTDVRLKVTEFSTLPYADAKVLKIITDIWQQITQPPPLPLPLPRHSKSPPNISAMNYTYIKDSIFNHRMFVF